MPNLTAQSIEQIWFVHTTAMVVLGQFFYNYYHEDLVRNNRWLPSRDEKNIDDTTPDKEWAWST